MIPRDVRGRRPAASAGLSLLLLLLAGAAGGACVTPKKTPPGARRVAVVGVDGATWSVLSPLMAAGHMPRAASLYRGGAAGLLRSLEPMEPAALWTSVATGRSRAAHGVRRSVEKVPARYGVRPVTADRRRVPALWTIASARGLPVGLSGWPVTFPAEAVEGFVLAEGLDEAGLEERGFMHPAGALADGDAGAGEAERTLALAAERIEAHDPMVAAAAREDAEVLLRALSLYRVYQPRLLMLRMRAVDVASHRSWPRREPGPGGTGATPLGEGGEGGGGAGGARAALTLEDGPVVGAYLFVEACLDILVRQLPEETALLVLSDHGFRATGAADGRHVDLDALLERLGYLAPGPGGAPDWERTRLFRLEETDDPERLLYVNLAGREERGIVEPAGAPALIAEAARRLRAVTTDRGEPLFLSVTEAHDPAPGEPDLLAREGRGLDPSRDAILPSGARIPMARLLRDGTAGAGAHDEAGVLLAYGSGVASGRAGWTADLYDVAPTILALLGLPLASDMPGRPIPELLEDPVPEDHPRVSSYDALAPSPAPLLRSERGVRSALERMRLAGHLR